MPRTKCPVGCTCGLHTKSRAFDWDDPEALKAYHRAYYQANQAKLRARAKPNDRKARLWSMYRLTPEGYEHLVADQDGLCYLCGEPLDLENQDKRFVCIDHDHSCCRGQKSCGTCIRGLACHACNKAIGYFGDDPERMRRVADNLEMANRRLRQPGLASTPRLGDDSGAVTPSRESE